MPEHFGPLAQQSGFPGRYSEVEFSDIARISKTHEQHQADFVSIRIAGLGFIPGNGKSQVDGACCHVHFLAQAERSQSRAKCEHVTCPGRQGATP
jgi:hypothetical protein